MLSCSAGAGESATQNFSSTSPSSFLC